MCRIVADIGVNHLGDMDLVRAGIDELDNVGVDYVKFQAWKARKLNGYIEGYIDKYSYYKKYELTDDMITGIIKYCEGKSIKPLFTAFDIETCHELSDKYNQNMIKIASPDANSWGLLDVAFEKYKTILVSTGMSTRTEVLALLGYYTTKKAVLALNNRKIGNMVVMHCVSQYPTPINMADLKCINELKTITPHVGYSDHTITTEACIAAIAMGCEYVEKHYTPMIKARTNDSCVSSRIADFKQIVNFGNAFNHLTTPNVMSDDEIRIIKSKYEGKWGDNF